MGRPRREGPGRVFCFGAGLESEVEVGREGRRL